MDKKRTIVFLDKSQGLEGDFPVAIVAKQSVDTKAMYSTVVDPVFNSAVQGNLYGRIMTLVEATCEPAKLKAVKDLFSKEIQAWAGDVYHSARELSEGGDSLNNIYTR